MEDEEGANWIMFAGVFAGLIIWLLYLQIGDDIFLKSSFFSTETTDRWSSGYFSSDCGPVTGTCAASVELKIDGCGKSSLKNKVEDALAFPMRMTGCRTADLTLSSHCPSGCSVDSSSMIVIPGELQFSMDETPNEYGECKAVGKRIMSLRATCKK